MAHCGSKSRFVVTISQDCFLTKFQSFKIVLVPKRVSIRLRISRTVSLLLMVSSSVAVTRSLSGILDVDVGLHGLVVGVAGPFHDDIGCDAGD